MVCDDAVDQGTKTLIHLVDVLQFRAEINVSDLGDAGFMISGYKFPLLPS